MLRCDSLKFIEPLMLCLIIKLVIAAMKDTVWEKVMNAKDLIKPFCIYLKLSVYKNACKIYCTLKQFCCLYCSLPVHL